MPHSIAAAGSMLLTDVDEGSGSHVHTIDICTPISIGFNVFGQIKKIAALEMVNSILFVQVYYLFGFRAKFSQPQCIPRILRHFNTNPINPLKFIEIHSSRRASRRAIDK